MILLSLIGEQPIPNLLAARALKPQAVVWAHTERTAPVAERLCKILDPLPAALLKVEPYDLGAIETALSAWLAGQSAGEIEFNLTGGTKPMAWAAERMAARCGRPFVYVQSEGRRVKLYRYEPVNGALHMTVRELPRLIDICDYLHAHDLWEWQVKHGARRSPFETLVEAVLNKACDEVKANYDFNAFEVDFLIRRGNHVGVVECKSGRWKERNQKRGGIDQLVIASDSKYLGTYTERFLIVDSAISVNLMKLAEARQVQVIVLPSAVTSNYRRLSAVDERRLSDAVKQHLG